MKDVSNARSASSEPALVQGARNRSSQHRIFSRKFRRDQAAVTDKK